MFKRLIRRFTPRFLSCQDWALEYSAIIDNKLISEHTKQNRKASLQHLVRYLGKTHIGSVRAPLIGRMVRELSSLSPHLAKRVLFEARDFFNEAILSEIIYTNPATPIKPPKAPVTRRRLTLEDWLRIRQWSVENQPPWVQRLLDLALVTAQRRSDLSVIGFQDIWDEALHVTQVKTGAKIAIPINLTLNAIGKSLSDVICDCMDYAQPGPTFIRRKRGGCLVDASLSARFEEAREGCGLKWKEGRPPSLHECRSLSERLYRAQGVNTRILLGHKHQSMTDVYNDDRGLNREDWQILSIP